MGSALVLQRTRVNKAGSSTFVDDHPELFTKQVDLIPHLRCSCNSSQSIGSLWAIIQYAASGQSFNSLSNSSHSVRSQ